ncbi:MAG: hypothetical protein GH152_03715 [Dehalococcoidia bacterium]|nr:hypothetical protein [Dehalococcoidia bacterium]
MNKRIVSMALAIILALIPCLLALAADDSTVTITVLTDKYVEITLEPTEWNIGDVEPNTECPTNPTWCTITNNGNCVVDIYIKGEDAGWVDGGYTWKLSSTENNSKGVYALWYHIAGDKADSYTPITEAPTVMKHIKPNGDDGGPLTLIGNGVQKKFGLKLLTPLPDTETGHFWGGREMKTTITISAVAA